MLIDDAVEEGAELGVELTATELGAALEAGAAELGLGAELGAILEFLTLLEAKLLTTGVSEELLAAELLGGLGVVVPVHAASSMAAQGSIKCRLQGDGFIIIFSLSRLKVSG